jgi:hypothetical protein
MPTARNIFRRPIGNRSVVFNTASSLDPWISLDGRLGAPPGAAQYPTLLNGYPTASPPNRRVRWPTLTGTQPQWQVAGVDYPVGIDRSKYPSNASLKDPNTFFAAGGSFGIDDTNKIWQVQASSPAVVDGVDFTIVRSAGIHAGVQFQLNITNTSTTTVSNCQFGYRMSGFTPISFAGAGSVAGSCTFVNNVIDGIGINGLDVEGALAINLVNGGTTTFMYNWFKNMQGSPLTIGGNTIAIVKYNLFDTPSGFQPPLHSHCFQNGGNSTQNWSLDIEFNTVRWQSMPTFSSQMWQLYNQTGGAGVTLNNPVCSYNTMIALNTNDQAVARQSSHSYNVGDVITGASCGGTSKYYWCAVSTGPTASSAPASFGGTVTGVSSANPCVVTTSQNHNYSAGQLTYFWGTFGALPKNAATGLALSPGEGQPDGTTQSGGNGLGQYYVLATGLTATSYHISNNSGGSAISTAGSGTSFAANVWVGPIIDGGVQWWGCDPGPPNAGCTMSNMIQGPGTTINITGTKALSNNYVDFIGAIDYSAGVNNGHADFTHGGAAEFPGFTISGNIDMRDGSTIVVS